MAKVSVAEKRAKNIRIVRGAGEPIVNDGPNYKTELMLALNYYNVNADAKQRRSFIERSDNPHLNRILSKCTDFEIRQIGSIEIIRAKGNYIAPETDEMVKAETEALVAKYPSTKTNVPVKAEAKVVDPAVKLKEQTTFILSNIQAEIDEFVDKRKSVFSVTKLLTQRKISPEAIKICRAYMQKQIAEIRAAYNKEDDQLVEAYSHFNRVGLRQFAEFLERLESELTPQRVAATKVRKARTVKEKPAAKLVAWFKYLKEFADPKLVSENPEKLVGAKEAWLYNTKTKKLTQYVSAAGLTLSVKGASIIGFDEKKSQNKTLRKPAEFFALGLAKKTLETSFKAVKAVVGIPNGRSNAETIIVKVF